MNRQKWDRRSQKETVVEEFRTLPSIGTPGWDPAYKYKPNGSDGGPSLGASSSNKENVFLSESHHHTGRLPLNVTVKEERDPEEETEYLPLVEQDHREYLQEGCEDDFRVVKGTVRNKKEKEETKSKQESASLYEDVTNPYEVFVGKDDVPTYVKHSIAYGDVRQCLTVKIDGISQLYLHLVDAIAPFRKFEEDLRTFFHCDGSKNYSGHISERFPGTGDLFCGMYLAVFLKKNYWENPSWYRAQVIYLFDDLEALVQLIDYGYITRVQREYKSMRFLPRALLLHQEVMAIPCKFFVSKSIQRKLVGNDSEMGKLLHKYLSEKKEIEVVKFHRRVAERKSNRIVWEITTMINSVVLERFTSRPHSVFEELYNKYFLKKERVPMNEPKVVNVAEMKDWDILDNMEENGIKLPDTPTYDYWEEKRRNRKVAEIIQMKESGDLEFLHEVRITEIFDSFDKNFWPEDTVDPNDIPLQLNEYDHSTKHFMQRYTAGMIRGTSTNDRRRRPSGGTASPKVLDK